MKSYYEREAECSLVFSELGECWHLSTSENFEIIFCSDDDFKAGMGIIAVCARMFPEVRIITFELMSNHIHITAASAKDGLLMLIEAAKQMLFKHFRALGRLINTDAMTYCLQPLDSLERVRNVITYDNRNGYLVRPDHTPFSYPWGANRYYFSPDSKRLALMNAKKMTFEEIRALAHTHKADRLPEILCFEGCALPLSFCDIATGELLFRDPSQYFYLISRNVENNKLIAREIGEGIFYTDNELFSAISRMAKEKFGCASLNEATSTIKLELAKIMRYEYNASAKQIIRFLKLHQGILNSIGII